jgi:hypothetical protein
MMEVREQMPAFQNRSRRILFDVGTTGGGGARSQARLQAHKELSPCQDSRVEFMPQTPTLDTWQQHYSTHQFGIVVRGTGWDTYRTWEYLFYGTVPILLKGTPMDHLHMPANTPVVFVDSWKDICYWDDEFYAQMEAQYEHWIANAHKWLRPSLWVPRNQTEMDRLCDISPGCRDEPIYMRMIQDAMDSVHYEELHRGHQDDSHAANRPLSDKLEPNESSRTQEKLTWFGNAGSNQEMTYNEAHKETLIELLESAKPGEMRDILKTHPGIVTMLKNDLRPPESM